jgi:hypothetical protein
MELSMGAGTLQYVGSLVLPPLYIIFFLYVIVSRSPRSIDGNCFTLAKIVEAGNIGELFHH